MGITDDHETETNENKILSEENDQEAFRKNTTTDVSKDILNVDIIEPVRISDKEKIEDKTIMLEEHRESHSLKIDVKNSSEEFENDDLNDPNIHERKNTTRIEEKKKSISIEQSNDLVTKILIDNEISDNELSLENESNLEESRSDQQEFNLGKQSSSDGQ